MFPEDLCFVLMPFTAELTTVYTTAIRNAAHAAGLDCERADDTARPGVILDQIDESIERARVIVADLTGLNPNVMQEVGFARKCGKPIVFITQGKFRDLSFDIRHYRVFQYHHDAEGLKELQDLLEKSFRAVLEETPSDRAEGMVSSSSELGIDLQDLGRLKQRDWRYQELAGYITNPTSQEPAIGVALDFGKNAGVFESKQQDHLLAIAREFLGAEGGKERSDDGFVELHTTQADPGGRTMLVQFFREGAAAVWVNRPGELTPWDWILVECYRVLRCLCCAAIRRIYGSPPRGQITLGVTWSPKGIDPRGVRLGIIRATPPSELPGWRGAARSSEIRFGEDPWPAVQAFGVLALSRAGYKHHEEEIRGIDRDTALEMCFPDPHPLRNVAARHPL